MDIAVPKADLQLTSQAPTLKVAVSPGAASLAITTFAPTLPQAATGTVGIASSVALGSDGVALRANDDGTFTGLKVFIAGVDRTEWVTVPSVKIDMQIGSRGACSFPVVNKTATIYRPAVEDDLVITVDGDKAWAGTIESTEEHCYWGKLPLIIDVKGTDYGVICDRRICGFLFTGIWGNYADTMLAELTRRFLVGTGITYVGSPPSSPAVSTIIGDILANWVPCSQVIQQIADAINCDWRVDFDKYLRLFSKDTGYGDAPFSLDDTSGNFSELRIARSRSNRRNRQGVKNSRSLQGVWTDAFPADWFRFNVTPATALVGYPTTYALTSKPVIYVNSVLQRVVEITQQGAAGSWDFYYINNGIGVFSAVPRASSDVVEILYPSPLSPIIWVEDAVDIAANGLWEAVEEAHDLANVQAGEELGAGLLERYKTTPILGTVKTKRSGLQPGLILPVNTTKPLCNERLLIESVSGSEFAPGVFWWTARLVNQSAQKNSGTGFFNRLISRTRQPLDRVKQTIRVTLAETVTGLANPGLAVGVTPAIVTSQADGWIRDAKLRFKSIDDGTLTTADIEVDVLLNGFSIFGGEKLLLAAGQTGQVSQWFMASTAAWISMGDIFTFEVLQADATATDGILELTIMG